MTDDSCPATNQRLGKDRSGAVAGSISSQELPRQLIRRCSTKPKPRWDVHLTGRGNRAGSLAGALRLLIAGPSVRRRCLTSSFRLTRPPRNRPTLSCTAALLPRHRLPVASSLAQPQIASSALKSGLYPGRFTSLISSPGLRRYSRTASPRWAGALSQITLSSPQGASGANGTGRPPRSRRCCCPPVPSIPPRQSPSTLLNSSWPSLRTWDCWSLPGPAPPSKPTCLAVPRPLGSGPRQRRISCRQWRPASSHRAAYSAAKAPRLA